MGVLVVLVVYSCLPCLSPINSNLLFNFRLLHVVFLAFYNLNAASPQVLLQKSTTTRSVAVMFSLTQLLHRYSLLVPWLLLAFSSEMIIIYLQKSVSARLTSDPEHSWPPFDFIFNTVNLHWFKAR